MPFQKKMLLNQNGKKRLETFRIGLPIILFVIVLLFEILEHFFIDKTGIDASFLIETTLFGILGPAMVFITLGWMLRLYHERAASAEIFKHLNEQLEAQQNIRRQLMQKIFQAQEEERRRVARQLHDEFAQGLMAFSLNVDAVRPYMKDVPQNVLAEMDRARALADEILQQTRSLMLDLRPAPLDELGLVPALRDLAARLLEPQGIQVKVRAEGQTFYLPTDLKTALYRMGQEGMLNAKRHAHPQHVSVVVQYAPSQIIMSIKDDGTGFQTELVQTNQAGGWGLIGLKERCDLFNGRMEIISKPGQGTILTMTVPISMPSEEA